MQLEWNIHPLLFVKADRDKTGAVLERVSGHPGRVRVRCAMMHVSPLLNRDRWKTLHG